MAAARRNELIRSSGALRSFNTLESLKRLNKNDYLNDMCLPGLLRCCGVLLPPGSRKTMAMGGKGEEDYHHDNPNVALSSSMCVAHCDLKSNVTVYWFAFPSLVPRPGRPVSYSSNLASSSSSSSSMGGGGRMGGRHGQSRIIDVWGSRGCRELARAFEGYRVLHERGAIIETRGGKSSSSGDGGGGDDDQNLDDKNVVWCPPYFLLLLSPSTPTTSSTDSMTYDEDDDDDHDYVKGPNTGNGFGRMKCLPLNEWTYRSLSDDERSRVAFGFVDPTVDASTPPSTLTMDVCEPLPVGWTMRNLVAYVSLRLDLGGTDATFLSYRCPPLRRIVVEASSNEEEEEGDGREKDGNEGGGDGDEDVGDDEADDDNVGDAGVGGSLLLNVTVPLSQDYRWPASTTGDAVNVGVNAASDRQNNDEENNKNADDDVAATVSSYRCVGWELNRNGRPGPRSVDLRPLVSPSHLVRQANDLNLRLMKWRALPELNVDMLSEMKVLLLGAGTLGCGVARTLLGWGVRNMTFVDSGRVSYSNPVRQSLFGIDDCKEGGKFKAKAAAEALRAIAGPDVRADGVVLTIPMPGHAFGGGRGGDETEAVRSDVERLHRLIDMCDVVFLLTDTRESRWLPTVMALATETPMINAALGLDSWLVMRHGPSSSCLSSLTPNKNDNNGGSIPPQRLGCYFCGDIVAPENSTRDRTLDQQCTVTRPGLAPIAASMATELMVAMFHHPLGHSAPAPEQRRSNDGGDSTYAPVDDGAGPSSSPLGRLPHQIRGTVATYTMMTPTVPAFPSCTACSDSVVEEYRRGRFGFVRSVCCDEDGSYLEEVSGLASFRELAARKLEECMDWDDDED